MKKKWIWEMRKWILRMKKWTLKACFPKKAVISQYKRRFIFIDSLKSLALMRCLEEVQLWNFSSLKAQVLQNFFTIWCRQILLNQYPVTEKENINSRSMEISN